MKHVVVFPFPEHFAAVSLRCVCIYVLQLNQFINGYFLGRTPIIHSGWLSVALIRTSPELGKKKFGYMGPMLQKYTAFSGVCAIPRYLCYLCIQYKSNG